MKYRVEVGSFCTRMVTRTIMVNANNKEEASTKAIEKFIDKELKLPTYCDFGSPQVDFIDVIE